MAVVRARLPSQGIKYPPLATLPRLKAGQPRNCHPYLKGVALHQRDILLIYQSVLGLEINHVSTCYVQGHSQVSASDRNWPFRL